MPHPRHKIIQRSRDRDFLLRTAIIIIVVAIGLGFVLSQFGWAKGKLEGFTSNPLISDDNLEETVDDGSGDAAEYLLQLFGDDPPPPEVIAALIRKGIYFDNHIEAIEADLRPLFRQYAVALHGSADIYATVRDSLLAAAAEDPPPRFANAFAGHLLQRAGDHRAAADHLATEVARFPDGSNFARRAEMTSLVALDDKETLRARTADPLVEAATSQDIFIDALVATNQWVRLAVLSGRNFLANYQLGWTAIALFAAMVWFMIIAGLAGIESGGGGRLAIYLFGFLLGCISAFAVMPAIHFQNRVVGLAENGEFLNDAVFFISGVALREELFKLLLFVPLLPILLKRRSSMEALATAGCVGLGFAFIENFGYTGIGNEGTLFARLVTANFLHVGWTGLNGLALFHLCRWPKTRWDEFLATILATVAAHGFYNLFASPDSYWGEFGAGLPPIFVLAFTAYRYLDTAVELREGAAPELSPFGVFIIGGALVVAFSWLHACWHQPMADVVTLVGKPALGVAALAFVFINRLRNV